MKARWILGATLVAVALPALAQSGTYAVRQLTPETAAKATRAALDECRKAGYQVAVAVVDRAGVAQALLRDRFAGPHTVATAINKGWTAISFRTDTLEFAKATAGASGSAGIRHLPNVVAVGGGVNIQAGGTTVGAIGVSGAPTGEADEACARAGIAAIRDELDF
jgi:uncharacterized protein GlcG (DUF336 family)